MQTVIIKKIKNQKSKIKNLFYLLIFVFANLYLSSCNQFGKEVFEEAETDSQTLAKEAQNWYQENVENPSYASEAEASFRSFRPRWEKAQVLKLSNSKEKLIVVPLVRNLKVNYGTKGFIRKLLLQTDKNNKVITAHIVEMIGEKQFLQQNENEILKNSQENQIAGFTRAIVFYDLSYNFLKGKAFKEGKTSSAVATMNGLGGYFVELGGIGGVRQAFNIELNSNPIALRFLFMV